MHFLPMMHLKVLIFVLNGYLMMVVSALVSIDYYRSQVIYILILLLKLMYLFLQITSRSY